MMTLDEAIEHAEWCVENSCGECAEEHKQLAEWLRELRELRESESAYLNVVHRLEVENAKLRELVGYLLLLPQEDVFNCRGCVYNVYNDCDQRRRCQLAERARELGIDV